jgi:hypothetical protein
MQMSGLDLPFVSVVIPVYNESRYIKRCMESVLGQDYPIDRYEVIVADGGSTDDTLQEVSRLGRGRAVRVVNNPRRTQAAGLNLAIAASRGEFIARQDGHAVWSRHHLSRSIDLLIKSGADCVGGQADAVGEGKWARAIAAALHSRTGVGNARFRYSDKEEEVHTVFPGTFRRAAFERVGLYNEAFPPHEDHELNHRIRKTGGRILYSPEIPTKYFVRDSVCGLARQYFRYGRAKVRVAVHEPGVIRAHHLVAPAFVFGGATIPVAVCVPRLRKAVWFVAAAYASLCMYSGIQAAHRSPEISAVRTATVFPVLHLSWGVGFWAGVVEYVTHHRLANEGVDQLASLVTTHHPMMRAGIETEE